MERIRGMTHSYDQHPGLRVFESGAVSIDPSSIPGMDKMRHKPTSHPPYLLCLLLFPALTFLSLSLSLYIRLCARVITVKSMRGCMR